MSPARPAARRSRSAELTRPPAALGYAMPAEWAPHARTWIAWPHHASDWPGKFAAIPWVYGEIVRHLAGAERVGILVRDAAMQRAAARLLERAHADLGRVDFLRQPTDRSWLRDSGPTFVCDARGRRAAVLWRFNAWARYGNWKRDARVNARIAAAAGVPSWRARRPDGRPFVLEGGAVEGDGEGTLLATEECLLDRVQERNPGVAREAQERVLSEALGARRVLWLPRGIAGDDTHGHVDDLARFAAPGRVLVCQASAAEDAENAPALAACWERLREARDAAGRRLELWPLPMPAPLRFGGRRVPASYANFYVANGLVLVPTFNDWNDRAALGSLARAFPERRVIGIHAVDLVWGLGTLHCLTQQEPRGR